MVFSEEIPYGVRWPAAIVITLCLTIHQPLTGTENSQLLVGLLILEFSRCIQCERAKQMAEDHCCDLPIVVWRSRYKKQPSMAAIGTIRVCAHCGRMILWPFVVDILRGLTAGLGLI